MIHQRDVARRLEIGQLVHAGIKNVPRKPGWITNFSGRDDEGKHFVAANFIRHCSDRTAAHCIQLQQRGFNFNCGNILAAATDHILAPVHEEQRSVRTLERLLPLQMSR